MLSENTYREAKIFAMAEQVDTAESCVNLAMIVANTIPEFKESVLKALMEMKISLSEISFYLHTELQPKVKANTM